MLKVLSLFSGIGGFDLGLERTGGFQTVALCEIDPAAQKVLRKHWPSVPIFPDITKLSARDIGPVDVIVGGWPCQDISFAGKRKGIIEGERSSLWREYVRLIEELKPKYVIGENVGFLRKNGLGVVLNDLARIGYDAEWYTLTATGVCNLPHQRERLFIIAYPSSERCDEHPGQKRYLQVNEKWESPTAHNQREECEPKLKSFRPLLSRAIIDKYRSSRSSPESLITGIRRVTDGIPPRIGRS